MIRQAKVLFKEEEEEKEVGVVYGKVLLLFACSFGFETGFPRIAQPGLKLMTLLP